VLQIENAQRALDAADKDALDLAARLVSPTFLVFFF